MYEIKHSLIIDIKILLDTLHQRRWLDKNGYIYFLFEKRIGKINYDEIANCLEEKIKNNPKFLRISKEKNLKIFLTRFGTYGSYKLPDKVFLNVRRNSMDEIVDTLVHEFIHLQIEDDVKRKSLSHEEKEKIVEEIERNL